MLLGSCHLPEGESIGEEMRGCLWLGSESRKSLVMVGSGSLSGHPSGDVDCNLDVCSWNLEEGPIVRNGPQIESVCRRRLERWLGTMKEG